MQLIILAAGLGSRFGGAKQITSVGPTDEIIADYSVYDALSAGFTSAIFVINRNLEDWFKKKLLLINKKFPANYVFQEINDLPNEFSRVSARVKPWGTGHAVYAAREKIKGNFAVINADDFYGGETFIKLAEFNYGENRHCFVGFLLKNTVTEHGEVTRGLCKVKNGYLTGICETQNIYTKNNRIYRKTTSDELDINTIVSMNAWGFNYSALDCTVKNFYEFLRENADNPIAEFYLPTISMNLIKSGAEFHALMSGEKWYGVTYKDDVDKVRTALRRMIDSGIYPKRLWG